jgi:hypothetical protein
MNLYNICLIKWSEHNKNNLYKCNDILSKKIKKKLNMYKEIYIEETYNIRNNKYLIKNNTNRQNYKCKYCNKIIKSKQNYNLHIKNNICKKNKKKIECILCQKNFKENRSLLYHTENNVCRNITNNIINNILNTTNNIQTLNNQIININVNNPNDIQKVVDMIPFKNVKYNITPEKYLEYARFPERAIKSFIKDEHFNPDKPERMNILNTNARSNKVQVLDHDEDNEIRWMIKSKTDINELLYDRGVNHLYVAKNILEENGIFLDVKTKQRLNNKINEYETNDKIKKEEIEEISDLTYNYRDIVDKNKKNNKLLLN